MPLGTKLTTADIQELANTIETERSSFETQINQLRARCVREEGFQGSAAEAYDGWMDRWKQAADNMDQALIGARDLLQRFHDHLEEINQSVADTGFNL
jgi:WXG100 family type VII secretion target